MFKLTEKTSETSLGRFVPMILIFVDAKRLDVPMRLSTLIVEDTIFY